MLTRAGGLDLEAACWCGLAKTAFRAAHAAPFALGSDVLIVGAGPVGQMTVRWAHAAGARRITVVDLAELRLQLASAAVRPTCTSASLLELRNRPGWDTAQRVRADRGHHGQSAGVCQRPRAIARPFGKLVLLGDTGYPSQQCLTSDAMTRGLTIVATHDHHDRDGWTQRRIDDLFFKLVGDGAFRLDGLLTHRFRPDDCVAAYALATDRRDEALGILFDWTQG